ncbi:MAG: right-handed parallel beta-helix repeat-containing protein, partial [Deltaproteobacteria bacterium]|nr:right-handed parallel beta-helix repeat-containing protein [Deltaproteobacteria bacterium]
MMPRTLRLVGLAAVLALANACTDDETTAVTTTTGTGGEGGGGCPPDHIEQDGECIPAQDDYPCEPGELSVDGTCLTAGVQANGCEAGQVDDGSGCRPAGLPPDRCASADDGGCVPLLPADPCGAGQLALPGETTCRDVAPCGSGTWGDILVEQNTQFVDAAYTGGNSDGTLAQPWTTVGQAVAAADSDAIVAIAAGSYSGVVTLSKPVRLWGRCPSLVELTATGGSVNNTIRVVSSGAGSEIRGLALTGSARGLVIFEATDVSARELWIHDCGLEGFDAWDGGELTLSDSLVEHTTGFGGFLYEGRVTVERTVIRDVEPEAGSGWFGIGILGQRADADGAESSITVTDSLIERTHWAGIAARGAEAVVTNTVVRDISSEGESQGRAHGIEVVANDVTLESGALTLKSSVIEHTRMDGVVLHGADGLVEATAIRHVQAADDTGVFGSGISAVHHNEVPVGASVDVRGCVITHTQEDGIAFFGGSGSVEGTLITDVTPNGMDEAGFGIYARRYFEGGSVDVTSCRIERVHESGVYWTDVEGAMTATVVRDVV